MQFHVARVPIRHFPHLYHFSFMLCGYLYYICPTYTISVSCCAGTYTTFAPLISFQFHVVRVPIRHFPHLYHFSFMLCGYLYDISPTYTISVSCCTGTYTTFAPLISFQFHVVRVPIRHFPHLYHFSFMLRGYLYDICPTYMISVSCCAGTYTTFPPLISFQFHVARVPIRHLPHLYHFSFMLCGYLYYICPTYIISVSCCAGTYTTFPPLISFQFHVARVPIRHLPHLYHFSSMWRGYLYYICPTYTIAVSCCAGTYTTFPPLTPFQFHVARVPILHLPHLYHFSFMLRGYLYYICPTYIISVSCCAGTYTTFAPLISFQFHVVRVPILHLPHLHHFSSMWRGYLLQFFRGTLHAMPTRILPECGRSVSVREVSDRDGVHRGRSRQPHPVLRYVNQGAGGRYYLGGGGLINCSNHKVM